MNAIFKAIKWAYSDTLRSVIFLVAAFLLVSFVLVLLSYPMQTIAGIIGVFVLWVLFLFVSEYK